MQGTLHTVGSERAGQTAEGKIGSSTFFFLLFFDQSVDDMNARETFNFDRV